jgi:hypothetical protein
MIPRGPILLESVWDPLMMHSDTQTHQIVCFAVELQPLSGRIYPYYYKMYPD